MPTIQGLLEKRDEFGIREYRKALDYRLLRFIFRLLPGIIKVYPKAFLF